MSTIKTPPPVFNVNIVGPLETEKPAEPEIQQPSIPEPRPSVEAGPRQPFKEKLLPETLYGEGKGVQPGSSAENNRAGPVSPDKQSDDGILPSTKLDEGNAGIHEDKPYIAPPSALFDKKTIEQYAKKEPSLDRGLSFEIPGFQHRGYMRMLKEKIESIWQYPKEAARLGISGDLYLKFSIKKDGKLGDIQLLRTSGYKDLDEAAIKALKDAEPFWPLPSDWDKDDLEINGHFIYVFGSAIVM